MACTPREKLALSLLATEPGPPWKWLMSPILKDSTENKSLYSCLVTYLGYHLVCLYSLVNFFPSRPGELISRLRPLLPLVFWRPVIVMKMPMRLKGSGVLPALKPPGASYHGSVEKNGWVLKFPI